MCIYSRADDKEVVQKKWKVEQRGDKAKTEFFERRWSLEHRRKDCLRTAEGMGGRGCRRICRTFPLIHFSRIGCKGEM